MCIRDRMYLVMQKVGTLMYLVMTKVDTIMYLLHVIIYINNNNNINNIYNNKIYINIINHWNSKKIGEVVSLNIKIIESINNAMTKYSFDEIKKAIDNYANVYNSDYFYDFQWHLPYFLTRNNAIGKFVDNGDIWLRYKQKYSML